MEKVLKRTIVILLILLFVMAGSVNAVTNYKITITPSETSVERGKTVTFTFKLTDIAVSDGIGAIAGKIEYDQAVFEKITEENITKGTGWADPTYNSVASSGNEGFFTVERSSGLNIKEDNEIFTITFKVLSNAVLGKTEIKINELTATDAKHDYEEQEQVGSVTIVATQTKPTNNTTDNNTVTNNTTNNNTVTNNTTNNTVINNTTNNTISNNTVNNTNRTTVVSNVTNAEISTNTSGNNVVLPYAGEGTIFVSIGAIALIVVIAVISFRRMKDISIK